MKCLLSHSEKNLNLINLFHFTINYHCEKFPDASGPQSSPASSSKKSSESTGNHERSVLIANNKPKEENNDITNASSSQQETIFTNDISQQLNTVVIAEELKNSINADSLKLVNDEIGDIGIKKIVESLTENSSLNLRSLNFSENLIGKDGIESIVEVFKISSLKKSYLNKNKIKISHIVIEAMMEALENNRMLTHLFLKNNQINQMSAIFIGKALKANENLIYLDLMNNQIDSFGAVALLEALESN